MQNGDFSESEYKRIKAEFEKIKAQKKRDAASSAAGTPAPPQRSVATPSPATKQLEARFTVTQGLLIVFLRH